MATTSVPARSGAPPTAEGSTRATLLVGAGSAWSTFALSAAYATTLLAAGTATGVPRDPLWAVAEVLVIVMALVLCVLMWTVQQYAPRSRAGLGLAAFTTMIATLTLTATVHFVALTAARQAPADSALGRARLDEFTWPSPLYAVEVVAWNLFFALSLLCAAFVFTGPGKARFVRWSFAASGLLTLAGLAGPAAGAAEWRIIGVLGYGLLFPVACLVLGRIWCEQAARTTTPRSRPGRPLHVAASTPGRRPAGRAGRGAPPGV